MVPKAKRKSWRRTTKECYRHEWDYWGALAFLPAFLQVSNVSPSQDATEKIARRQHGPIRDKVGHGNGTADSSNWSGYAVVGSSFTSATGSWVVPAAVCTGVSGGQDASFWVGLDGDTSSTVEQIGTDSDCDGNNPSYYAWYEFYPKFSYEITTVPVNPGNVMSASVICSGGKFTVTITNVSTGNSYTTSAKVESAKRSSAEWITEAPCCTKGGGILPLSDFGTVYFGPQYTEPMCTAMCTNAANGSLISTFAANIEQITKVGSSTSPQTSTCSGLFMDGNSFSCTWAAQ